MARIRPFLLPLLWMSMVCTMAFPCETSFRGFYGQDEDLSPDLIRWQGTPTKVRPVIITRIVVKDAVLEMMVGGLADLFPVPVPSQNSRAQLVIADHSGAEYEAVNPYRLQEEFDKQFGDLFRSKDRAWVKSEQHVVERQISRARGYSLTFGTISFGIAASGLALSAVMDYLGTPTPLWIPETARNAVYGAFAGYLTAIIDPGASTARENLLDRDLVVETLRLPRHLDDLEPDESILVYVSVPEKALAIAIKQILEDSNQQTDQLQISYLISEE